MVVSSVIKDGSASDLELPLTDLAQHPTPSDLAKLLQFSVKSPEIICTFAWPALGQPNAKFILGVISPKPIYRNNRVEQEPTQPHEADWRLLLEVDDRRQELWHMRTVDIDLILGFTAFDSLDQINNIIPNFQVSETSHETTSTKPLSASGQLPTPSQQPLRDKSELPDADGKIFVQKSSTATGLVLAGNIKDVEISSIMQSIVLCKMTGRLNLMDTFQQIELYFIDGELTHARAFTGLNEDEHLIGENAVLDIFTWTDGSFKFQHGWRTAKRTVQRRLDSLLLEGATLLDYKSFLAKRKISPAAILVVAPDMANISEAAFDQCLKAGVPSHLPVQKQVFLMLRSATPLQDVIDQLKLPHITWMPVIFNLFNLNLITMSHGDAEAKTKSQFDSINELIATTQKALRQPESNMFSYPLFLFLAQNELKRCSSGGLPFCIAMLEFDQGGYPPDRSTLPSIAAAFDAVHQPLDVVAYAMPNQCFMLFPQSQRADAHRRLDQFTAQIQHKSSIGLSVRIGVAFAPEDGNDLKQLLNHASQNLKGSAVSAEPLSTI